MADSQTVIIAQVQIGSAGGLTITIEDSQLVCRVDITANVNEVRGDGRPRKRAVGATANVSASDALALLTILRDFPLA